MIGLLLLFFIGQKFYILAEDRGMNKWLYAFLGIAVYYLGTFIAGFFIGVYLELFGSGVDNMNTLVIGLITMPFGLLAVWGLYFLLDRKWKKEIVNDHDEIEKIGTHIFKD